jgi:hypothetical protein
MAKYLSGRVKRTSQSALNADRYQYLALNQAEPNLGDPVLPGTTPPFGEQYQSVSIIGYPGQRYWVPVTGSLTRGSISIYDEGILTPPGGISSTTLLNFVGAAITAKGYLNLDGSPGVGVTITVFSPGTQGQFIFNNNNEFTGASGLFYDSSTNYVGIGTSSPTQKLDLTGDLRLRGTIYDYNNQPGNTADILVKNNFGGLTWINQSSVRAGAGGTIGNVQYHNNVGLVDGAPNFVFDAATGRVGIGSTIPAYLFDVLGYSRFTGQTEINYLRVTGVSTIATLGVTGVTTTKNLTVSETSTFTGTITANGGANIDNVRIGITDDNTIDTSTGNLTIGSAGGRTSITGITSVGFVTATTGYVGILTVGEINVNRTKLTNLEVTGIATIATLGVGGGTTTRNLQVIGVSTIATLGVTGLTTTRNLIVTGIATFNDQVNINNLNVTGVGTFDNIKLSDNTVATTTGNLVLDSALGTTQINDSLYVDDATQSTNKDTGSIITEGGVGIEKNLNVGGASYITGIATFGSNVLPYNNATQDLGSLNQKWRDIYSDRFNGQVIGYASSIAVSSDSTPTPRYIPFIDVTVGLTTVRTDSLFVWNPSSDSLGIGTANPKSNLDIVGTANITGVTTITNGDLYLITNNSVGGDILANGGTDGIFGIFNTTNSGTISLNAKNSGGTYNSILSLTSTIATVSGIISATGQIISTKANNTATGGGQIYLNGATGNRIDFNTNGVAAPTFTTRNVGTKLVLYPAVSASQVDYALGIDNNTLWYSVDTSASSHKWYAGTTNIATLFGTGELVLGTTTKTGTASQPLQVTGGAYVSGNLGIKSTTPRATLDVNGDVLITGVTTHYGDVLPGTTDFYNVGSLSQRWNNIYAKTFVGQFIGIADTANKAYSLTTARTISITGDLAYTSPGFDGTQNVTADGTLSNTGVTAGTYGSSTQVGIVTVDAKGRITSASNVNINFGDATVGRANSLTNARDFSIAGDVIAPAVSFNGTANVILNSTLKSQGIAPNVYGSNITIPVLGINTAGIVTSVTTVGVNFGAATVAQADKLTTPRNIAITGDLAWNVNFDGSQNVTADGTLSITGVTAGTYGSSTQVGIVTVDAKGRITSASNVDIAFGAATVDKANRLTTPRNIAITGDLTWDVNFDGSQNVTATGTLANSGVVAGTYGSTTQVGVVTVDAKGRVTAASNVGINFSAATVAQADAVKTISSTATTLYPTFVDSDNATGGYESVYTDAGITYNALTNVLNIGGSLNLSSVTPSGATAIFTRGADANFQLTAQNGPNVNASGQEVSRFGIAYSGSWNTFLQFIRGNGSTDGSLAIYTNNTSRLLIDSSGNVLPQGTSGSLNLGGPLNNWGTVYATTFSGQFIGNADTASSATTATYLNTANSSSTADDIRNRLNSGFWQSSTATTGEGWPTTTNDWYHLISSTHSNDANYYALQLAAPFRKVDLSTSRELYFRTTNGNGNTAWTEVITTANIGTYAPTPTVNVTVNQTGYGCVNPITTSGSTINIASASNAYGRKFVTSTEPTGVCDGDVWYDTSGTDTGNTFATGTTLLFYQASAPTGWTKLTTHDDKALRVVSGATGGGAGGAASFTSVFTNRGVPVAQHSHTATSTVIDPGHTHPYTESANSNRRITGNAPSCNTGVFPSTTGSNTTGITVATTISPQGTAGASMDFSVQYIDIILCSKN